MQTVLGGRPTTIKKRDSFVSGATLRTAFDWKVLFRQQKCTFKPFQGFRGYLKCGNDISVAIYDIVAHSLLLITSAFGEELPLQMTNSIVRCSVR